MIVHEAVRMDKPSITFDHGGKNNEKDPVVLGICKNTLSGIPP